LIELLAPGCIPKFKRFDVCFAMSHFDWPMTKKNSETLGGTSGRSLHYRNRIVEVFSLCNTIGKIICLLWFVKFISSPNAQPLSRALLVLLQSPWRVGVHWGGCIMFRLAKSYWKLTNFVIENSKKTQN
jgi:hypothetical protein